MILADNTRRRIDVAATSDDFSRCEAIFLGHINPIAATRDCMSTCSIAAVGLVRKLGASAFSGALVLYLYIPTVQQDIPQMQQAVAAKLSPMLSCSHGVNQTR